MTLSSTLAKPLDRHLYCYYFGAEQAPRTGSYHCHTHRSPTFKQDLIFRAGQLFLIAVEYLAGAVDMAQGIGVGLVNALTLRKCTCLNTRTQQSLDETDRMLSYGFFAALRILNPEAEVSDGFEGGMFTAALRDVMREKTLACLKSNPWFTKHGISRLVQLAGGLMCLLTRALDFVIGMIAGFIAFAKKGRSSNYNTIAFQGLKITAILSDLIKMITAIFNPVENRGLDIEECLAERDTNHPPVVSSRGRYAQAFLDEGFSLSP